MVEDRVALARRIIDYGLTPADLSPELSDVPAAALVETQSGAQPKLIATQLDLAGHWPAGLAPTPAPIDPVPDSNAPFPHADYVVVTWTVAEVTALADVLTPGLGRDRWYRYTHGFDDTTNR